MRHDEALLRTAIEKLRQTEPEAAQVNAASQRVADRLEIDAASYPAIEAIGSCGDVRQLLTAYRGGNLSDARRLVIQAHLRDCGACQRYYRGGSESAVLDWSSPKAARGFAWRPRVLGWALAPACALLVIGLFFYRAFWQVPPGVRADVQSIDGAAYRISDLGDRQLSVGDRLQEGERFRTGGGARAVLRLADGSSVEVNERSVLGVGERGRDTTISLDNGAVIVQAVKRTSGHLYVKTADCRVAVTGTVFSVDSGIKGSRVAVVQGAVHVTHAGVDKLIRAGDQLSTNENLGPEPVDQQIAWSQNREQYLVLLGQFDVLRHRIEQIPMPQLRYTSDLLPRIPADTLLYISIPNLGDFLSEAEGILHDQLKQSAVLEQWWNAGHHVNTADLDTLVEKIHQMSQYLGDEVVIVGLKQTNGPGFAVVADVQKNGLADFLNAQFASSSSTPGFVVLDETSLAAAPVSAKPQYGEYALVRPHEAVFSNNIATLKQVDAQLNAGASGFATGALGEQISSAYGRGAGVILAADLHQMLLNNPNPHLAAASGKGVLEDSGVDGVRYLIAEHRETNGVPENHLNLQFAGTRQGIASWLAAPAPIGALDFVTPNAAMAVALLSKDPTAIADDMMAMAADNGSQNNDWDEVQAKLQIDIRNDLAANLGGEFLVSLDGPVLPTPSWKAIIEVRNADQLEQTLERMTTNLRNQAQQKQSHVMAITSSEVNGQLVYSLRDTTAGTTVAQYTFADGYMIVASGQALLLEAIQAHDTGNSLARSTAFKALLPVDANANYSAVVYQNVSPVLTPLLSQVSGEAAQAVRQMAADARPTAICAWGKDNRIEAASNSHLFGFDFLALPALIHSGNQAAHASVRE
jgi:FecR protein/Putative zinc-finger